MASYVGLGAPVVQHLDGRSVLLRPGGSDSQRAAETTELRRPLRESGQSRGEPLSVPSFCWRSGQGWLGRLWSQMVCFTSGLCGLRPLTEPLCAVVSSFPVRETGMISSSQSRGQGMRSCPQGTRPSARTWSALTGAYCSVLGGWVGGLGGSCVRVPMPGPVLARRWALTTF